MHTPAASSFDVVIAGAGSVGMAAGYHLAKAGQKVLMLDPGDPPHSGGSHHGHTRLIRHAYGEGAAYVPLALHAHELWFDLERELDTQIFVRTGVLNAAAPGDPFIAEVERSAREYELELERMDGAEVNRRWPVWKMPPAHQVCFEPDAGLLFCQKAVAGYRKLAAANGAVVKPNTAVTRIEPNADGTATAITAAGDSFTAPHLIVCAGKATRGLIEQAGTHLPISRVRKFYGWFDTDPKAFGPDVFPSFALTTELGFHYGFADLEGRGVKVGRHDGGQVLAPDAPIPAFDAADLGDIEEFLRRHLPGAGKLRVGETCEYDMSPDEDFIVDRVPGHPQIQFATGFSGHGFKFSSAIGEALAQRIVHGECKADLSRFGSSRFKAAK